MSSSRQALDWLGRFSFGGDLSDADCVGDLACQCEPRGAACSTDDECCSGSCKNNGTCR